MSSFPWRWRSTWPPVFALAGALAVWNLPPDAHWLVQQVQVADAKTIYENRQGVIALVEGGAEGDMVFGGNAYDGRTNTDLVVNSNGLQRLTLMSIVQPRPRRVLIVGMSIGSWLAVVRRFPGVEHIDVIEINPGYLAAAQVYPAQRAAMTDLRVSIHIDDARRWLRRNPAERYDAIIMNTTYHWRSNTTLLLSSEFLSILQDRLEPGGVLCFNATGSLDALFTASSVFTHAWRYSSFVYAADHDFRPLKDAPEALQTYRDLFFGGAVSPAGEQLQLGYQARPFDDYASDRRVAISGNPASVGLTRSRLCGRR